MTQWQDISTAPKDGRLVLVCDGKIVVVAAYTPHRGWGWSFLDDKITHDEDGIHGHMNAWMEGAGPTYWMPLPAPSTEGKPE